MCTRLLFVAMCVPVMCAAQLQVKGVVNMESGSALPYASVLLLNSTDSTLVRGQVSGDDGSFLIDVNEAGSYFVRVSALGYDDVSTDIFELNRANSPVDHGTIRAVEKVEKLNEVIIDGDRPLFEQKIDRTIINVQSNISRAGGSALDILQRSPGVTVDKLNSAISLSGKQGVRIMINGRISRIPMASIVQMLEGMNAENIDRIELITTPPSKYEAEGDAGMINIVMKKTEDIGTNGNFSAFTGYGRRAKLGGTLSVNNRTKRLNVYGDAASRHDFSRQNFNTDWRILVDNERKETISLNAREAYTGINRGSVGFDWTPVPKTSVGGMLSVFDRRWDMDAVADISKTVDGQPSSSIDMNTVEENDWFQLFGNINVRHEFNKDYALSLDFDRIDYNSNNPTDYHQDLFDALGNSTEPAQMRSRKETGIDIWTSALDFTGKVDKNVTLEIGAKGSFTSLDNDIAVQNFEDGAWRFDEPLTSYAEMQENIYAGYVSAHIKASAKTEIQAGLRYEHTKTNIDTREEQDVIDRNFGKWFPTFFINRKINEHNSWVASYSRRIARPSFFQLAPFVIFNDPDNFFSGNIALLPSFTDAFKLEYRRKSVLVSLQYSHDKNSITLFQPRINADNKQVSTAQNLDYRNNFSLVFSFPVQVAKWWEIQVNAIGSRYYVKVPYLEDPITLTISNFSLNGSSKFTVSKTITAELSGFYQSRQFFGILNWSPMGAVDFGIEKKFANSNLRISCSDIFGTNKWEATTSVPEENLDTRFFLDFETTVVNVTYSRNFGNSKLRNKQSRKTASKEEQDRLR